MWLTILINQDVARFDVAMQDAALMSMLNGTRELCSYFRRAATRQWVLFNYLIKPFTINQVHTEIARAVRFSYFVNWNNTGMIQPGSGFGLEAKPLDVCFRGPPAETNDLQCYYEIGRASCRERV